MSNGMYPPVALVLCCLIACITSAADPETKEIEEWREITSRVYGYEGPKLKPEETLDLLKRAKNIYARNARDTIRRGGSLDANDRSRDAEVTELIGLDEEAQLDCDNLASYRRFDDLIDLHNRYYMHIVPYIIHYNQKHFLNCQSQLIDNLRDKTSKISSEAKNNLNSLTDKIRNVEAGVSSKHLYVHIAEQNLIKGLLAFIIDQKAKIVLNKQTSKNAFEGQFQASVENMCREVDSKLENLVDIFDTLVYVDDLIQLVDDFMLEWIVNGRVCRRILRDYNHLMLGTYDLLTQNVPSGKSKKLYKREITDPLYKSWHEIYQRVFGDDEMATDPGDTLYDLRRLEGIYPRLDRSLLHNEDNSIRWPKINGILKLADKTGDEQQCTARSLEELNDAINSSTRHKLNVIPLLIHIKRELFIFCLPTFTRRLQGAVAGLKPKHIENAELIANLINMDHDEESLGLNSDSLDYDVGNFDKGVFAYLKQQSGSTKPLRGKNELKRLFTSSLLKSCNAIDKKLKAPMEVYDKIIFDEDLLNLPDQFTKDWMERVRVCKQLLSYGDDIVETISNCLSSRRPW